MQVLPVLARKRLLSSRGAAIAIVQETYASLMKDIARVLYVVESK
jgi:hypothetical protein